MYDGSLLSSGDNYNRDYFLQEDVCRLCWNKKAIHEISSKTLETDCEPGIQLKDQIQKCLNIKLSLKCCPNKICNECYDEIKRFYKFKNFCQLADKKLRAIFQNCGKTAVNLSKCSVKVEQSSTSVKNEPCDDLHESLHHSDLSEGGTQNKVKFKRIHKVKRSPTFCTICRLDLITLEQFAIHKSQLHGIEKDCYRCFGCDKRFRSPKTRLGHEIKFCKELRDGYRCAICQRCLPERRTYEAHMRDHRENVDIKLPDNLFKCKKCYASFKTREDLREHVCKYKTEKKKFICESCGRVFSRQDYLHKHNLTHTGVKQHVCPHCGFRTTQRSSLTVHIRKHTGERPFSCTVCPQRCISSSNLRAHVRRHLGLKTFECTLCDKKFGYKGSLEEHVEATHKRSQKFACRHCGATYARLRGLRRHLLTKHETRIETGYNRLLVEIEVENVCNKT